MLYSVFLALSLCRMHMHKCNRVNFKLYLSHRPHPSNAAIERMAASYRHDRTIEMDGNVLTPLEPRYSWTLETGMIVTEPLASQEAWLSRSRAQGTRSFAPCVHAKCTSGFHDHHACAHGPAVALCTRLWPILSICRTHLSCSPG